MRKIVSIFLPLALTLVIVVFPYDAIRAETTLAPQLGTPSPTAISEDEKALIDDILRELEQARKLTNDKDVINQIGVIKEWVKKIQALEERGDRKAALQIKYAIAKRLEALINQVPLSTPGMTAAVAAVPAQNPLYDELVRIRAKIQRLIDLEEREIPTITPREPPEIQRPPEIEKLIIYSAKFLCGPALGGEGVQPGSYSTAINIHNPQNDTVYLFKKAVIANREDEPRGRISPLHKVVLQPDEAIEVDCIDIVRLLGQTTEVTREPATQSRLAAISPLASPIEFIKGFVVIYTTAPLDIDAVYTGSTAVGFSLDVERISPSTAGIRPIPIPEEPRKACPQGCYCMLKDDALLKLGPNASMCTREPCAYKDNNPLYCWKPAEEVCPPGCLCLTKDDAAKRNYTTMCHDKPCAYKDNNPLYCWKPAPVAACPADCLCLTREDAYQKFGTNAVICQKEPCGYDERQNPRYCWKSPPSSACPTGCECLIEAEANKLGYTWCQNQRIQCGTDASGAKKYCFQRVPVTPPTPIRPPTQK